MKKGSKTLLPVLCFLMLFYSPAVRAQQDFGEVSFSNSGPATVQADFLRGLAQLHNFEYDDAAEHFRSVQKAAPDFAMAYWGEAMTQNHPVWHEEDVAAARKILDRLAPTPEARLAKATTEREKLYLHSVEILYGDGSKEERDRRYEAAVAEIHRKFPDDVDAAAFYALATLGTAEHGRDFATYMRAAAVLEEVFPQHPRHPGLVHYLIHCYDDSVHAPLGLRAARIYSRIAPEASHAQHMTSHIFLSLGMWDDVVRANETAMAVVNREREKAGKGPGMCGHYNEWLEYGYLQQGRIGDARRILEGCRQVAEKAAATAKAGHDDMGMSGMSQSGMTVSSYAEMRAHFLINAQLWNDEVAHWKMPAGDYPFAESASDYTDTIAAVRRGDLAAAREAAARTSASGKRAAELMRKMMNDSSMDDVFVIYNGELHAMMAAAEGKSADAVAELKSMAAKEHALPLEFGPPNIEKPTDELLGELLLQLHRPAEARDALQTALARTPGRKMVVDALARADKEIAAAAPAKDTVKQPAAAATHHQP